MYEKIRKTLEINGFTIVQQEPWGEGERYGATNKNGDKIFFEIVYKEVEPEERKCICGGCGNEHTTPEDL